MKERRYLITTALEETWPESEPSLFLGEWCLQFERKEKWEKMEAVVLPFHWSNYAKLEKDYHYLTDLYEKILPQFTKWLNEHHKVDLSVRYWRILIGPWLIYFTHIVFERWESINKANESFDLTGTIIMPFDLAEIVPCDMGDFVSKMVSDKWNHFIYSEIIKKQGIKYTIYNTYTYEIDIPKTTSYRQRLRNWAKYIIYRSTDLLSKNNIYFIGTSYLGNKKETKLNIALGQFSSNYRFIEQPQSIPTKEIRKKESFTIKGAEPFADFLALLLPKQLPTCFLEGYSSLLANTSKLPYPVAPKVIFTSNFLTYDVLAMSYTAKNIELGARLVIGQHGGYGIPAFMSAFDHEKMISDCFLSWGWLDTSAPKMVPIGILKPVEDFVSKTYLQNDRLLLIRGSFPRYTFRLDSGSGADENNAIERCLSFAGALPKEFRKESLLVRLYSGDYGYGEKARWEKAYPEVRINYGNDPIINLIKGSRIVVYSYNMGTGYLEYLSANIPTIVFWDMIESPVCERAKPYFEALKAVGIFHDTPESAANHVSKHWDDIDAWWKESTLQITREWFCKQYAYVNDALVENIASLLRQENLLAQNKNLL